MKRITMVLLTGILILSLAACGNAQTNAETAQEQTQSQSIDSADEDTKSQADDNNAIKTNIERITNEKNY